MGRITLNRPDTLNAWNAEFGRDLKAVVEQARRGPVGAGRAGDRRRAGLLLGGRPQGGLRPTGRRRQARRPQAELHELYHPIIAGCRTLEKPVVAAVNGPAVGIGLSLALACDLVLAAESAFFGLAFVNIGLMPDGGSTLFVPAARGQGAGVRDGDARRARVGPAGPRVGARQPRVPRRRADGRGGRAGGAAGDGPHALLRLVQAGTERMLYPDLDGQLDLEAELQHALGAHARTSSRAAWRSWRSAHPRSRGREPGAATDMMPRPCPPERRHPHPPGPARPRGGAARAPRARSRRGRGRVHARVGRLAQRRRHRHALQDRAVRRDPDLPARGGHADLVAGEVPRSAAAAPSRPRSAATRRSSWAGPWARR